MGGGKKNALTGATRRATVGQELEDKRAQELQDTLANTRNIAASEVAGTGGDIKSTLGEHSITGGYNPGEVQDIQNRFKGTGAIGEELARTPKISNEDITASSFGRGREGYEDFATTGGFKPGEGEAFIRSGTRAAGANYAANKDELARRLSLQGGYMPGFTSGAKKLTRSAANAGAEAATNARVSLAEQIRKGRIEGLGGLERTREASGKEAQASQDSQVKAQIAGGELINKGAIGSADLATSEAKNRQTVITQMLDYYKSNVNQMTNSDKLQIENRLAQLGMTRADIDAFLGSAGQQRSGLDTATGIIGAVGDLAGGAGGLASGLK